MSCSTAVSRNVHPVSDNSASCNARLRRDATILADNHVVRDLHEVIQLRATLDVRRREGCPVNGGIRANFHVILNNYRSDLGDFVVQRRAFLTACAYRREAEPITADNRPAVNNHPVTDGDFLADVDVWVNQPIGPDFGALADIDERLDDSIIPYLNVVGDDSERLDGNALAKFHVLPENRRIINTRKSPMDFIPGEHLQNLDECPIGVLYPDRGLSVSNDIAPDDNRGCLGCLHRSEILRVRDEGNLRGKCLFDTGNAANLNLTITG